MPRPLPGWAALVLGLAGAAGTIASLTPVAPLPPALTTITPDNPQGTPTPDVQPTFTWHSPPVATPPGPFHYDLFVFKLGQSFPTYGVGGLTDTIFTITTPLERNVQYRWKVVAHLGPDSSVAESRGPFLVLDPSVPGATILYQNFPNPFPAGTEAATCLWFDLATTARTELAVLDLRGNPVRHFL